MDILLTSHENMLRGLFEASITVGIYVGGPLVLLSMISAGYGRFRRRAKTWNSYKTWVQDTNKIQGEGDGKRNEPEDT